MEKKNLSKEKVEEILKELGRRKGANNAKYQFAVDGDLKSTDGMGNIASCNDFPDGGAGNVSACDDDTCSEAISGNVASCTDNVC
jgi:hypothetical protein